MKNTKKMKMMVYGAITLLAVLNVLVDAPNLNPMFIEGAFFWCVLITAYVAAHVVFKFGDLVPQTMPNGLKSFKLEFAGGSPKKALKFVALPWIFLVVVSVMSSVLFNSGAYRDQLGDPELRTFSSDMQVVDQNQIPIVDKALAKKLADKKLGEKPSLGSQVYLGEPTIQQVDGKLVWAVPLHHSGLFKWFTNMEGTPGYVVVSATNVNDVKYVENYKIKYHPNSYLLDDLTRHLRLNGALFSGITDFSFELDDAGQPYWIASAYHNLRGFALPEANGIYAVNASTGETTHYALADVPKWVDRVQPEEFILQQIANKGEYVHGIFNFSDEDKYRQSIGQSIIYNNGRCYLFTGLTSVGQDESAIGFMMVDMVTKQPLLFQMNGATEMSAQSSAQGKVQHLGYVASFPLILNIDNEPTYFMTLKDREGLIKQYAFVSVRNYSSVGVGETIKDALRDYETVLKNDGSGMIDTATGELKKAEGTLLRITGEFSPNGTTYMMIIEGSEDKIFAANSEVSPEIAISREGDKVSVSYYESKSPIAEISEFDNMMFTQETK